MASSDDTKYDLIDNSNHIITSHEDHETRITRTETEVTESKSYLECPENQLDGRMEREQILNEIQMTRTLALATTRHLKRIQDGFYKFLENKLSPKIVSLYQVNRTIDKIERLAMKRCYRMGIKDHADILKTETNFVSLSNGIFSESPIAKSRLSIL